MSQRAGGMNAQERQRQRLTEWDRTRRRWAEEGDQAKLAQGFTLVDGKWFKPEPDEGPDYCRECCSWDRQEGIWKVTCFAGGYEGLTCELGHDHHDGEVWMA